jgi:proteasome lid subunit RPN8/RPN11
VSDDRDLHPVRIVPGSFPRRSLPLTQARSARREYPTSLVGFASATGTATPRPREHPERSMAELDGVFYKEIVEQALREFPNEACGLIAAEAGVPVKVYAMTNADASPATYRLDGKEQLTVFDELDDRGWDLWAIYHSHTHSEAYPSETDRKLAFYPDSRYVLLSVADRDDPVIRSFFILDGEVTEEELTIT